MHVYFCVYIIYTSVINRSDSSSSHGNMKFWVPWPFQYRLLCNIMYSDALAIKSVLDALIDKLSSWTVVLAIDDAEEVVGESTFFSRVLVLWEDEGYKEEFLFVDAVLVDDLEEEFECVDLAGWTVADATSKKLILPAGRFGFRTCWCGNGDAIWASKNEEA